MMRGADWLPLAFPAVDAPGGADGDAAAVRRNRYCQWARAQLRRGHFARPGDIEHLHAIRCLREHEAPSIARERHREYPARRPPLHDLAMSLHLPQLQLISAGGNINNPGVYEIEMNITVEEFIYSDQWCGGIKNGKKLKACVPGGSSVPILPHYLVCKTANGEDRLMTYESLADAKSQPSVRLRA